MLKYTFKKYILYFLSIILTGSVIFVVWANTIYIADRNALGLVLSNQDIIITDTPSYWKISPKNCNGPCSNGLIFYPGAKVDPTAYFYKFSDLTMEKNGYWTIFVTKPVLNLAFFGINQADTVIKENPTITKWAVGGHSLGGAMMCEYLKNPNRSISTLILVGSYCASDISQLDIQVISIHGSQDGLLNATSLMENRKNLPLDTTDITIEGMNHAQAGNYGKQNGDNEPTLSDEEVKKDMQKIILRRLSEG